MARGPRSSVVHAADPPSPLPGPPPAPPAPPVPFRLARPPLVPAPTGALARAGVGTGGRARPDLYSPSVHEGAPNPSDARERLADLRDAVRRAFIGRDELVDRLLVCLIARGHVLVEDVPGVGKTVLATALARSIDGVFHRVQLTPDLLPADVLGVSVFDQSTGSFRFRKGPIFANLILADEINRTTPRTQSALLESMNEGTVSVDGVTHVLDQPFMVIATQNPFEFEGTYPLPENQLDRFLMQFSLGYPSGEDEARILETRPGERVLPEMEPVMTGPDVIALQRVADGVRMDRSLVDYVVAIAAATREHPELRLGLSTRGSLALTRAARAEAVVRGRDYVTPDDIVRSAPAVATHRVLSHAYVRGGDTAASRGIIEDVLARVPSPA